MTFDEAKTIFLNRGYIEVTGGSYFDGNKWRDSVVVISKWLKEEPCTDVLDKIRNEILEEKECAYADFEQYKVEYLGQDWEDAYDSLPQDDFRYGMERCIEIIDKYKVESEDEGCQK